jgi:hypothetical protein
MRRSIAYPTRGVLVSIALAILAVPRLSVAQNPPIFEVDDAALLECVQSLEKGLNFSQIDTTALQCAHIESQRCMKVIGENYPTSIAQGTASTRSLPPGDGC